MITRESNNLLSDEDRIQMYEYQYILSNNLQLHFISFLTFKVSLKHSLQTSGFDFDGYKFHDVTTKNNEVSSQEDNF